MMNYIHEARTDLLYTNKPGLSLTPYLAYVFDAFRHSTNKPSESILYVRQNFIWTNEKMRDCRPKRFIETETLRAKFRFVLWRANTY